MTALHGSIDRILENSTPQQAIHHPVLDLVENLTSASCPFGLVLIRNRIVSLQENCFSDETAELNVFLLILQSICSSLQRENLPVINLITLLETVVKLLKSFRRHGTVIPNCSKLELSSHLYDLTHQILPTCCESTSEVAQHAACTCLRQLFLTAKIVTEYTCDVYKCFTPHCSLLLGQLSQQLTKTYHPIYTVETLRFVHEVCDQNPANEEFCPLDYGDHLVTIIKVTLQLRRYRCTPTWQICLFHDESSPLDESQHCDEVSKSDGRVLRRAILVVLLITRRNVASCKANVMESLRHFSLVHHLMCDQSNRGLTTLAQWVIDLYIEQDSMLCDTIKLILEIEILLKKDTRSGSREGTGSRESFRECRSGSRESFPESRSGNRESFPEWFRSGNRESSFPEWISSYSIFTTLLKTLKYDQKVILDWLISPETTEFLHYLTLLLKNIDILRQEVVYSQSSTDSEGQLVALSAGLESVLTYAISSDDESFNDADSNSSSNQSDFRDSDNDAIVESDSMELTDVIENDDHMNIKTSLNDLFNLISQMSSRGTFPYPADQLLKLLSKFLIDTKQYNIM